MQFEVIRFIGHNNHRLLGTTQDSSYFVIQIRNSIQDINDKQDHVCLFKSDFHLLVYLFFKNIIRINHPSAGVNQRKFFTRPLCLAILTVAGSTCFLVDNRLARLCQTVEEGGLSYVGSTNYCNNISHKQLFLSVLLINPADNRSSSACCPGYASLFLL